LTTEYAIKANSRQNIRELSGQAFESGIKGSAEDGNIAR
jgi:hypothetical protein